MPPDRIPFQFSIAALFRVTLFAAVTVAMFTLPIGDLGGRMIAGFAFGGAAIGTLFGHADYGAVAGYVAFMIGAKLHSL
jgi:hypothetical protein